MNGREQDLKAPAGAVPCAGQSSGCERCEAMFRERFPILSRKVNGHPLVYLDSSATAQKPEAVIAAEARFYREHNANVHRGMHSLAAEATDLYEACRKRVARFLGVSDSMQVVVTSGTTEALNLAALGTAPRLRPGDEILVTEMEHHANLVPWFEAAKREGAVMRVLPILDDGRLDLAQLPALLNERTRVVALTHVSNVLGTINPVAEVAEAAHRHGALVVVDAAQSVGHMPLRFDDLGADLLAFSAHKVYGPMGLGFLVGTEQALADLAPITFGGEMIETVTLDGATWAEVPFRFEAGTPNVAGAAAFPPALDMLDEATLERVRTHEISVTANALETLSAIDGMRVFGPTDAAQRGGLVSFHDPFVHPHDMAQLLDARGVAVRAGHHCAQPLHRRLGVVATTRASFALTTTHDEIDMLADAVAQARSVFGA